MEAAPAAEPEEAAEAAVEEQWTSAAPAITHLNRQFFAPPQELKPAPVEDQVMETGHDLQLRIYMREILEPWWTGEVGSTTRSTGWWRCGNASPTTRARRGEVCAWLGHAAYRRL